MNKRSKRYLGILVLICCLLFSASSLQLAGMQMTVQAANANSTSVKNGWKKEKAGYCYYVKGKKVVNKWKTISGKKYYFGADGARKTGWYSIKNKSYYFTSKGVLKKSKSMDADLLKAMDSTLKKAGVKASVSKSNALKKSFAYVQKKCDYARVTGFQASSKWEYEYAKDMLNVKKGSCYHYAAAFAFLAKRATGYPVRICVGTSNAFNEERWQPHAWTEIQIGSIWYTYDANAARYSKREGINWYKQKKSAMEGTCYKTEKTFEVAL